ncbi:MAG: nitroreductase [Sphingobacteriales bacterium]
METEVIDNDLKGAGTLKTIYERRAVRKYKDRPVDHETIEKIIDAGRMAPSAVNKQEWKFYILTNKDTIKTFSKEIAKTAAKEFLKSGVKEVVKTTGSLLHSFHSIDLFKWADPIFYGAPVVIFITAPKDNEWAGLDIGMCAENMMLAANALGLDSCPVGLGKFVEQTDIFYKLRVPATEKVHLAVILGHGDETPEAHERIKENAVFIDRPEKNMFKKAIIL